MTRTPRVVTALLASAAVAAVAAAPAMAGTSDKPAATKLLRGTVWTTYQSGNVTGASLDRSVTLCRDNTYRYGTVQVAYTTDAGERGSVVLAANRRGATLAGVPAQVGRTSAC